MCKSLSLIFGKSVEILVHSYYSLKLCEDLWDGLCFRLCTSLTDHVASPGSEHPPGWALLDPQAGLAAQSFLLLSLPGWAGLFPTPPVALPLHPKPLPPHCPLQCAAHFSWTHPTHFRMEFVWLRKGGKGMQGRERRRQTEMVHLFLIFLQHM